MIMIFNCINIHTIKVSSPFVNYLSKILIGRIDSCKKRENTIYSNENDYQFRRSGIDESKRYF
ncbi:hypothetical protein GCM10007140_35550 [Priestia taiwanensis]|uniref:Uncharacterized protein n=1 Tax=Priestia taiwanensis TaxID=1347902 RepID=A0A917AYW6_9BACI|nr:hypothetical protein GCM10007140_35550 [Priestia taiwanensis]